MASATDDEEEGGGGGGWLVSFADLMTLLFAAFVVLYGITPQGESIEVKGNVASIRASFVEVPDDVIDKTLQKNLENGVLTFDKAIRRSNMDGGIKKANRSQNDPIENNQNLSTIDLKTASPTKGTGIQAPLSVGNRAARHELRQHYQQIAAIYYQPGQTSLTTNHKIQLAALIAQLGKTRKKLVIEGHTDTDANSSLISLMEISALRAANVKKYLMRKASLPSARIAIASYGSLRPVSSGPTAGGAEVVNDRVTISLEEK